MFAKRIAAAGAGAPRLNLKERIRILGGALRHPIQTRKWLRFLEAHPPLSDAGVDPRSQLGKIHLPYLSTQLDLDARVELLIRHYEILTRAGFGSLVRQAASQSLTLCTFTGKSGVPYELRLSALEPARQDGEILLRLFSRGICIYTIALVVVEELGETCLKVGGLRGMLPAGDGFGIKQVTRDLYGCRPKDLMVALARDLGNCFGCRKLILVGNRNKLPCAEKWTCRKSSDYDQTWKELHAAMRGDGDWELACGSNWSDEPSRPTRSASSESCQSCESPMAPSKRSVLLESIRVAVRANMTARRASNRYLSAMPNGSMSKDHDWAGRRTDRRRGSGSEQRAMKHPR